MKCMMVHLWCSRPASGLKWGSMGGSGLLTGAVVGLGCSGLVAHAFMGRGEGSGLLAGTSWVWDAVGCWLVQSWDAVGCWLAVLWVAVGPLVFKGLVARTEKTTKTEPNATKCNWTTGCGCGILKIKRLEKDWFILTGFNRLQLVF